MNDKNELVSAEIGAVVTQIDNVVKNCMPAIDNANVGFMETFIIAQGMFTLRELFTKNKEIEKAITAMANTPLGFMTDRSPAALAMRKPGKQLKPYTYPQLAEACIEAMLNGYRLTNSEFAVIAGRYYAMKNGKYRKIIETPGLTDFKFTTTPPLFDVENRLHDGQMRPTQIAKVQGFASWKLDGVQNWLGQTKDETDLEDKIVFKIKVNAFMGDDGVKGKAESKLFSKVLERITGRVLPESTDADDVIDVDLDAAPTPENDLADVVNNKPWVMPQEMQTRALECAKHDKDAWELAEKQAGPILNEESFYQVLTVFDEICENG